MRKLVTSLVCAGSLVASSAQALDLGALHVYSEAGQPLDAEIQLLDVEGLSADDILPRFAGVDDLALSGLDDKRYLSDVRFFVAIEKDKSATLRLVSNKPIKQSFLSFLLEVNWPQGRLLREYTALLKGEVNPLPSSAPRPQPKAREPIAVKAAPVIAPVVSESQVEHASPSPVPPSKPVLQAMQSDSVDIDRPVLSVEPKAVTATIQRNVEPLTSVEPKLESPEDKLAAVVEHSHPIEFAKPVLVRNSERVYVDEQPEKAVVKAAEPQIDTPLKLSAKPEVAAVAASQSRDAVENASKSVAVNSKQTLWDIAHRYRPHGDYSNQQMMLALYEKNPQAFIDGDINRMKGHAVLSLPSVAEIGRNDHSTALRKIREKLNASSESATKQLRAASHAEEVLVGPKDMLWDIAVKYRAGPEVNTRQMMLAIVKKNPHAFVGGNINQMLKGVVLKMPTVDELRQWSEEDASAEVRRQISDWRSGDVLAPNVAEKSVEAESAVTVQPAKPEVKSPFVAAGAKRLVIGKKETLWSIALKNLPDESITTGEMIKAIIKKNPHAFVNGNMNEMRVGEVLNLPTLAEIHELKGN